MLHRDLFFKAKTIVLQAKFIAITRQAKCDHRINLLRSVCEFCDITEEQLVEALHEKRRQS